MQMHAPRAHMQHAPLTLKQEVAGPWRQAHPPNQPRCGAARSAVLLQMAWESGGNTSRGNDDAQWVQHERISNRNTNVLSMGHQYRCGPCLRHTWPLPGEAEHPTPF